MKKDIFEKIWYGGDYNPDQWLDRPDILEQDIRYMKEAHINCATVGVFSWTALEPEEDVYTMEWLENIIENLYQNGISTILATPSAAVPAWMAQKYPEILQTEENGIKRQYGNRHNFCPTSPVMRRKTRQIDEELAKRFGKHPGVILWHISNEMGGNGRDAQCHCELCQEAFREWLKKRYGTLEELNRAWYTAFWSHAYTDWSQIHSPSKIGEDVLHGLKLDWRRFTDDQMLDFCSMEIDTVKKYSDVPATTNMMAFYRAFNYHKWAKKMDIISWDNYPYWHSEEDEMGQAAEIAAQHSLFRTLKNKPYLMMESTPSAVNWRPENILKRPGMNELSSLQAIANGGNSVQYFQFRQSMGSCEKFHGAVIGHLNGNNTRVFRDVTALGERLQAISELVTKSCNKAKVAVLFDAENRWAIEDAWAIDNNLDYYQMFLQYFRPLWEMGIDADIIDMDSDMTSYSLVIAPYNYMYRGNYVQKVTEYVENGGVYATTSWSGEVGETDLCFLEEHPLRKVLGIRTEEIDVPNDYWRNHITYNDTTYDVTGIAGLIHAENAIVLATYDTDFYAGRPAFTVNKYGKGKAFYFAAQCGLDFLRASYQKLLQEADVKCDFCGELPIGVTVNTRMTETGKQIFFLQNYNRTQVCVPLKRQYCDIVTNEVFENSCSMKEFSCLILREVSMND